MENSISAPPAQIADDTEQLTKQSHYITQCYNYVTVYTSKQPCNKSYFINDDWRIEKSKKQPTFFGGTAIKRYAPDVESLAAIIQENSENPCLCLGLGFHSTVPVNVLYSIISQDEAVKAVKAGSLVPEGELYKDVATGHIVACRLKAVMSPSSYVLFDKDEGGGDINGWIRDVASFVPNFDKVDKIIIQSNSSRVGMADHKFHVYVKITNAMDVYDLKDRMLSAGHAAGHGVDKISKGGTELSRIITDVSVFSPERIIYDGKPIIHDSDDSIIIKPVDLIVNKGSNRTLDTSKVKAVDGYGAFTKKKVTTIDAQGNKQDRTISKVNGIFNNVKLKSHTLIEMKLAGKVVTKTIQQVIDEKMIEQYGGHDGKIRCQATFDDRDSKSFNGILRYGADGKPHLHDNGSGITYKLGKTTGEMFANVPGFMGNGLTLVDNQPFEIGIPDYIQYSGDLSHADLSEKLGEVFFFEKARYVHKHGKWFLWDGTRWMVDGTLKTLSLIQVFLRKTADKLISDAEAKGEEDFTKWAYNEAKNLKSAPLRINVESIIKADPECAVLPVIFDKNLKVIGTPGGTVNLETGSCSVPNRSDYITKLTVKGLCDKQPSQWLKFLNRIFAKDVELIAFIQRLCGYALSGLTIEEKLFFLYGKGANGKSKFLEILFYILGDYARRAPASMFAEQKLDKHPTELAGLQGARLVVCSELPDRMTWNEQIIKDLTGGDTITARLMRQDFFDYKPQFKIFVSGNHKPRLRNVDESMARRMVLIPFNVTIPKAERDLQLGDKLKAEASEILNWCVHGAVEYFKYGLQIPRIVENASVEYLESEDVTGEFISDNLIESHGGELLFKEVFLRYSSWLKSQGYDFVKTERQFRKELIERNFLIKRSNNQYRLYGYELNLPDMPPHPERAGMSFI